ncbi:hypothetical protein M407DRAFT_245085 [Tulasnella calospora MUT 4182]|uniref:Uncharacterized protein n=1 Tax=Tulasnella calospora MUT 4182 TaxID=1051891 RepID=A0A0C3QBR3_9AGAM|nr:hypothetical protein M407DRAFT_245085 [Tulasnella calospora MUT 4182]
MPLRHLLSQRTGPSTWEILKTEPMALVGSEGAKREHSRAGLALCPRWQDRFYYLNREPLRPIEPYLCRQVISEGG